MIRRQTVFILAGLLLLVGGTFAFISTRGDLSLRKTAAAPNITLDSLGGEEISLRQFQGNLVLVNFWATWCPPCQKEIPALEAAFQANKDQGFVILGVNVGESPAVVETFTAARQISYPILLDTEDVWMDRYGSLGLPMSVVIGRDGSILEKHMGELTEEELGALLENYLPSSRGSQE